LEKIAPLERGEILSLSDIFALFPKDLKELQVAEILGAPFFMRVDGKRWCQASVWKGGRSSCPPLLPCRKARKDRLGENKKIKGGV
jgi:hypothetical protein